MQGAVSPLIYVLAFVATFLLIQGVAALFFSARDRSQGVNRRLTMLQSGMEPVAVYAALARSSANVLTKKSRANFLPRPLDEAFQRAQLEINPIRFLAIVAGCASVLWIFGLLLIGLSLYAGLLLLIISCTISVGTAWAWLNWRHHARVRLIEEQMPVGLDIMTRGLRAGHPVISAIHLAAEEMGDPIGSEFGLVVDETTYGMELKDALTNFARRTGSPDAHFLAVSVAIQSQTGGNLAKILEGLATVIRGRLSLIKRVRALSSEGRASAMILSALPLLLVGFFAIFHPDYYTAKFSDPVFWPIVAGVCFLYVIGRVMIYRITHFKY
jgi:tight adherence protein B